MTRKSATKRPRQHSPAPAGVSSTDDGTLEFIPEAEFLATATRAEILTASGNNLLSMSDQQYRQHGQSVVAGFAFLLAEVLTELDAKK